MIVQFDEAGDLLLSAEQAAGLLHAPLDEFLDDLRAGYVYSIVERGSGDDAGHVRATLRRRGTEVRLILEAATGRVLDQAGPTAGTARDAAAQAG